MISTLVKYINLEIEAVTRPSFAAVDGGSVHCSVVNE